MRDAIIIFMAIILAMLVGSYLFFNGGPEFNPPPSVRGPEASFSVLAEGQNSGSIERRTNFRILNEQEFVELWSMIYGTAGPSMPYVNFERDEVIAVFDGTHSSGGYRVSVTDVVDENGARTIRIQRETPGDTCMVTEAITSPFQLVRVTKTFLPIAKEEEMVIRNCD